MQFIMTDDDVIAVLEAEETALEKQTETYFQETQ